MRCKIGIFILLGAALFASGNTHAAWQGPTEIVKAGWGSGKNQVGFDRNDMRDLFPEFYDVANNGSIIITDSLNGRFKVYSTDGQLIVNFTAPRHNPTKWSMNPRFVDSNIVLLANDIYFFSLNGKLINTITLAGKTIDHWLVEDNLLKIRTRMPIRWETYSSSGQLIKATTREPNNFGEVEQHGVGWMYKIRAIFPDAEYNISSPQPLDRYYRDSKKYLYQIETYVSKKHETVSYRIHKYNLNGEKVAELTLPISRFEPIPEWALDAPTWISLPIIEYGSPIIVANGDIYCWARTKTHFKILKWTWVDEATKHKQSSGDE